MNMLLQYLRGMPDFQGWQMRDLSMQPPSQQNPFGQPIPFEGFGPQRKGKPQPFAYPFVGMGGQFGPMQPRPLGWGGPKNPMPLNPIPLNPMQPGFSPRADSPPPLRNMMSGYGDPRKMNGKVNQY